MVVALIIVGSIAFAIREKSQSSEAQPFQSKLPPVEFVYLDGTRILDFLSQLEGGQVGTVHRISKEIASVKADAGAEGFSIGASTQHESVAESVVTRTEASELGLLLDDLARNESHGVSFHAIELTSKDSKEADFLKSIREGMLVRFVTHDLLSPGYIHPYVVVRQSATLGALFPQVSGNAVDTKQAKRQRSKAESFVHQVGPDPRITFVVAPRSHDKDETSLKVLMPMRYSDLTQERSLLERGRDQYTGGRLVVFGKVIRVFRHETPVPCPGGGKECPKSNRPEYIDFATREIWRNPIEHASNFLIDDVSHSCKTRRSKTESRKAHSSTSLIEGRGCFLAKLKRQTALYAPGAVILPIAVYK